MFAAAVANDEDVHTGVVHESGRNPGEAAARAACAKWKTEGREVQIARAPPGKDFNDLLIEEARHG